MMHQHLISNVLLWLHFSSINIWEPSYKSIFEYFYLKRYSNSHTYNLHFHNFYFIDYIVIISTSVTFLIIYIIKQFLSFTYLTRLYKIKQNEWNLINYSTTTEIQYGHKVAILWKWHRWKSTGFLSIHISIGNPVVEVRRSYERPIWPMENKPMWL